MRRWAPLDFARCRKRRGVRLLLRAGVCCRVYGIQYEIYSMPRTADLGETENVAGQRLFRRGSMLCLLRDTACNIRKAPCYATGDLAWRGAAFSGYSMRYTVCRQFRESRQRRMATSFSQGESIYIAPCNLIQFYARCYCAAFPSLCRLEYTQPQ